MPQRPHLKHLVGLGVLAALLAIGWLLLRSPEQRQEFGALPGAVGIQEGTTLNPQLFRDAQDLLASGDVASAEALYRDAVLREPANPAGYIGLGSCRYFQQDYAGAEQNYQKALSLDPQSSMALMGLGSLAQLDGDQHQAIALYERALTINPSLGDVHWGLAVSYDALGNQSKARTHYEQLLELAPGSQYAEQARARLSELPAPQP
jgi:Tfp pilus assembly protein PilF